MCGDHLKLKIIFIIKIYIIIHIIIKKKACNTRICIDTFKIKHNFYHTNINNYSNYFFSKRN